MDRPVAARHTPTKNTSSSSGGGSSGNGNNSNGGTVDVGEEDEDDEADSGSRSQVSLGHQAELMEQLLGGVHLSLSNNSQDGNNNNDNTAVEEGIDEGGRGESANWVGEEVEEEADV